MSFVKIKSWLLILSLLHVSGKALAFVSSGRFLPLQTNLGRPHGIINLHPYRNGYSLSRFSLYQHGLINFSDYGKLLLRESMLNHGIEIVAEQRDKYSVDYHYRLAGHKICDLSASLHKLRANVVYYQGQYPTVETLVDNFIWPDIYEARNKVKDTFSTQESHITSFSSCLLSTADGFLPVYDFTVNSGGLLYQARVSNDKVLTVQRKFFDVQGEFYIYEENKKRNHELKKFLISVKGNGFLENTYFKTKVHGHGRAHRPDNVFAYRESDPEMAEASAFAHVNLMLEWFLKMGYSWQGNDQVIIELHADKGSGEVYDRIRENPNNALYLPKSDVSESPRIILGDGDGVNLQGIPLDGDVVSHELGHHVLYHRLTSTFGESLIVHEGMSDYFTFAKTNDPCLAESTCTAGSQICQLDGACLRHADHNLVYSDVENLSSAHLAGQIVSGLLWDLREKYDINRHDVDRIVFKAAVSYLMWNSGIRGLIESVLAADYKLFKGKNCPSILTAAATREMDRFTYDLDCANVASIEARRNSPPTVGEPLSSLGNWGEDKKKNSCAVIALSANSTPYALILVLVPALFVFVMRRVN